MPKSNYNVLLMDDSEDDYIYIRTLLDEAEQVNFNLTWINTATQEITTLEQSEYIDQDLYLLSYDLDGEEKGLEFLKQSVEMNSSIPSIFLTDHHSSIDRKAFALGATDVLCKDNLLTSRLLERSILHALERNYFTIELREVTERLILAKTSANLGVWEYNVFEDSFVWDDRTCELYGLLPQDFKGKRKDWEVYIYDDDLPEVQDKFKKALENQQKFYAEFRIVLQKNKIRYLEVHGVVIGHSRQRSQRMIGITLDISDRKETEAKLQYMNYTLEQRIVERTESIKGLNLLLKKQSESFYHTNQLLNLVMNSIPQGIFWKNRDSVFLGGNQRFADDVGIPHGELKGKNMNDLPLSPAEIELYMQSDREVMEMGQPRIHFLETIKKANGSIAYVDTTKVPLRDQTGHIIGVLGCYEDVSDRKNAELERQQLLQELSAFKTAIDRSASIAVTDSNGVILEANDRFCAISGYERSELLGQTHQLIKSNYHSSEFYAKMWKTIKQGNVWQGEICNRSKTGQIYWEESSIVPLLGTPGEQTRYLAIRYNISSRKLAEKMIQKQIEQEKLLRKISELINQSLDLQSVFDIACHDIRLLFHCDRVCILKFHSFSTLKNGTFIAESCTNDFPSILSFEINSDCFGEEQIKSYESGSSTIIHDIEDLKNYDLPQCLANALNQFDVKSYLSFPLQYSDRLWGLLCIHHCQNRSWETGEIDFSQQLANQLAIAIQQASLVEQLQQELQDRQAIQQQLAERNEQLAIYNEELLRATRLKDEFLASMSHELRTPLNAILGMSEVLQEDFLGTVNPGQRDALQTIQRSGAHLLELINDILDVAKIESGQLELHFAPVVLPQLCQASLTLIHLQATQKNIIIQHSVPETAPQPLVDERRIRQVLVNLLNNAVKFTAEEGIVSLKTTLTKVDHSAIKPYRLQFIIEDTGIGIAPEHLSQLFQPFVQVDSALNRQYSGTGLGLALVKRLVELHQGTITVTSEVGIGSCFTVTIPCQVVDSQPIVNPSIPQWISVKSFRVNALENMAKILLAEDNLANVTTIKLYLESQGYEVFLAHNGAEAIVVAQSQHPQLILMDIQMPMVDGLEAIEILRRDPDFDQTPIIALTALVMPGDRDRCLASGATDYLPKPVQLKALDECIQKHLRHFCNPE